MKITLITYGSRGDVQPVLALAVGLQKAGHEVLIAAPPENAVWVRDYGQRFMPFGSPFTAYADQFNNAHGLSAAFHFAEFLLREVKQQFDQACAIISNADLVIGASLVFSIPSVAEYLDVPYRFVAFCPQIIPSAHHPYPAIAFQRMPAALNRFSWRLSEWTDGALMRAPINRRRRQLGLAPIKSVWKSLLGDDVLVASDPLLAQMPPDTKVRVTHSGYLHLEQHQNCDPLLQEYIEAGAPPVFFGFGSMPRRDSLNLLEMFQKAANANNCRALIYTRGRSTTRIVSDDCCIMGDVVHTQVLPRCAAAVHHGGAGTTAAAARAGIPQIIVPHMLDQFYWAHQIERLGLGPRGISRLRLSTGALSRAIHTCLNEVDLRIRCRQAAFRIKPEASLEKALTWIQAAERFPTLKKSVNPTERYATLGI